MEVLVISIKDGKPPEVIEVVPEDETFGDLLGDKAFPRFASDVLNSMEYSCDRTGGGLTP